ncbi:MAG: hypothetical protein LQ351_005227 [Letrouitia transgressa]|nr:MAG: hypothetical protein LQ351_005227 [Letrouitia transgressa]
MPPELPGFYFDQERNRYFKIQPHHVAVKGTGYSQQEIEEAMERLQAKQALAAQNVLNQPEPKRRRLNVAIQRAPILQRPCGMSLQREVMADQRRFMGTRASLWADGLEQRKFLGLEERITHLVRDHATKTLCFVTDSSTLQPSRYPVFACTPLATELEGGKKEYHIQSMRHRPKSPISSFCLSPCRVLLSTTYGAITDQCPEASPTLVASHLTPANQYLSALEQWENGSPTREWGRGSPDLQSKHLKRFDEGPVVGLKFRTQCSLWDSAAGPQTDDLVVAIAIDGSISQYKGPELQFDCMGPIGSKSDALSVDYQDHNVILSGYRNGLVRLWDTRSQASTIRLQHPSSVAHARAMTGHRIAVAGLSNQLCVYDLRYTERYSLDAVTKPSLWFSEHKNMATLRPQLGFDVHQNLVAAATDDNSLHIFDTVSGQALPIGGSREWRGYLEGPARCIEFVDDDRDWGDGLRLLVAQGNQIDHLAW